MINGTRRWWWWFAVAVMAAGCGGGGGGGDAAGPESGAMDVARGDAIADAAPDVASHTCATDMDCNDGIFCNGVEHCVPGATGADVRGCVAGNPACPAGQTCDEHAQTCGGGGCPDADGDGHRAATCGGDDCDDTDPHRFPGNTEVCAVATTSGDGGTELSRTAGGLDPTHDEDCDPTTFSNAATHDGDHDGDGYVDAACSNRDSSGTVHAGDDCADLNPVLAPPLAGADGGVGIAPGNIHPMETETCNGVDDNCNGVVDEGVGQPFYADCDGDMYGAMSSASLGTGCYAAAFPPCNGHIAVTNNSDCDDTRTQVHPGAMEACDGLDDNCDGAFGADEDVDGDHYFACPTTPASMRDCDDLHASIHPGATEVVDDNTDEDCDGRERCYVDVDRDHARPAGDATVSTANLSCDPLHPASGEPYPTYNHAVTIANDCCDSDYRAFPGQTIYESPGVSPTTPWMGEVACGGGWDFNCDGVVEQDPSLPPPGTTTYDCTAPTTASACMAATGTPGWDPVAPRPTTCGSAGSYVSSCSWVTRVIGGVPHSTCADPPAIYLGCH